MKAAISMNMRTSGILLYLCLPLFISLFATKSYAGTVSVAVAANVQFVFEELSAEFKKETGHDAIASVGSSGKLVTQITQGAPFDVFLSADTEYPDFLFCQKFTANQPKIYAHGELVLWTAKKIDLAQWQQIIKQGRAEKIAIANPATAPYGREAINVLRFYKLESAAQGHLVLGESIAQTNQYIHAGVVDFGFTAKSVVISKAMAGKGQWLALPKEAYQSIAQAAVILKNGQDKNPVVAQAFFDFLYSPKARAILQRGGYALP